MINNPSKAFLKYLADQRKIAQLMYYAFFGIGVIFSLMVFRLKLPELELLDDMQKLITWTVTGVTFFECYIAFHFYRKAQAYSFKDVEQMKGLDYENKIVNQKKSDLNKLTELEKKAIRLSGLYLSKLIISWALLFSLLVNSFVIYIYLREKVVVFGFLGLFIVLLGYFKPKHAEFRQKILV